MEGVEPGAPTATEHTVVPLDEPRECVPGIRIQRLDYVVRHGAPWRCAGSVTRPFGRRERQGRTDEHRFCRSGESQPAVDNDDLAGRKRRANEGDDGIRVVLLGWRPTKGSPGGGRMV